MSHSVSSPFRVGMDGRVFIGNHPSRMKRAKNIGLKELISRI